MHTECAAAAAAAVSAAAALCIAIAAAVIATACCCCSSSYTCQPRLFFIQTALVVGTDNYERKLFSTWYTLWQYIRFCAASAYLF